MDLALRRAFRFFHANAGYVVGERAVGALALAKAERAGKTYGLAVVWGPEEAPDLSWMTREERAKDHTVEYCAVYSRCECCGHRVEILASCGNIVDADTDYRRVMEAELVAEALTRWTPPDAGTEEVCTPCAEVDG